MPFSVFWHASQDGFLRAWINLVIVEQVPRENGRMGRAFLSESFVATVAPLRKCSPV